MVLPCATRADFDFKMGGSPAEGHWTRESGTRICAQMPKVALPSDTNTSMDSPLSAVKRPADNPCRIGDRERPRSRLEWARLLTCAAFAVTQTDCSTPTIIVGQ